MICHHCQRYDHRAEKCRGKKWRENSNLCKCAANHKTSNCSETEEKCINCMRKGNKKIDHASYGRHC